MSKTWVIADPHFGHQGVCTFLAKDHVSKLRPWDDASEMSEFMVDGWNSIVHPNDRVYVLGDVAMNRKSLDKYLPRLMGRKVLVRGNHDTDKLSYYSQYFDDVRAYVIHKGLIMSHIPIHPDSMGRWAINIHGHLHDGVVRAASGLPDKRYVCVSVEHTGFLPKDLQLIKDEYDIP